MDDWYWLLYCSLFNVWLLMVLLRLFCCLELCGMPWVALPLICLFIVLIDCWVFVCYDWFCCGLICLRLFAVCCCVRIDLFVGSVLNLVRLGFIVDNSVDYNCWVGCTFLVGWFDFGYLWGLVFICLFVLKLGVWLVCLVCLFGALLIVLISWFAFWFGFIVCYEIDC